MKKALVLLVIAILVCQGLSLICPAVSAASLYLHDDFSSTSTLWNLAAGSIPAIVGIPDSGATDGKVLKLVFPAGDSNNHPLDGPTVESTQEYSYGTFKARMKAASCKSDEGVISAFFTYFHDDTTHVNSEIDFEILGASPYMIYMTVWTKYASGSDFSRTARAVDLQTGKIWETPHPSNTWDGFQLQNDPLPQTIPGYDSSADYYEYGFTWLQNSVNFYIVDAHGSVIDLWNTPGNVPIPTHPAKICFEVWHPGPPGTDGDTSWTPEDKKSNPAINPPSSDAVVLVDWVDYKYDTSSVIQKSLNWLREPSVQGTDGSWSFGGVSVGPTALAVMSFINYEGFLSLIDPTVAKGLNYILSQRDTSSGSFGSALYLTYETSLAIMALSAARSVGYNVLIPNIDQYIMDGMNWLLSNQNIESNLPITPDNKYYGGWGYGGKDSAWADLSNTQFAAVALSVAESTLKIQPHLSNWQAAAIFVARCNNNAANNPQYYYKDDGGFIYQPHSVTRTSTGDSYGSMTAAGVWVLGLAQMAGVTQINMQVETIDSISPIHSGLKWLEDHYSVTQNPVDYSWGGDSFTYYYFWSVAKAWEITSQTTVAGHEWYTELTNNLASTQSTSADGADGHWSGTGGEEPDLLATEWAILTLELAIVPQPILQNSKLAVTLHSGADLHVYDQQGRHIGYNYSTQQNETQIPGATYTGRGTEPQIITVPLTEGLNYTIEVAGTTGGSYELVVDLTTYDSVIQERPFNGTTSSGITVGYSADVVNIGGLWLLVQPVTHYLITFDQICVGSDFTGTVITIDGTNYTAGGLPVSFLWDFGSSHDFAFEPFLNVNVSRGYCWWFTSGLFSLRNGTLTVSGSGNVTATFGLMGDINHDGTVSLADLMMFANAYGSQPGCKNWNCECDVAAQGRINLVDLVTLAIRYGTHM
jgi:hypothetical protein